MLGSFLQGPRQSRVTWGMAQGLLLALFLLLVLRPGVLGNPVNSLQWSTLDLWAGVRETRPSHSVTLLGVDEATMRRWNGRTFDAPDIARALRLLRTHGARAVALDFPSLCDAQTDLPGRDQLAAAMRFNGHVTLPFEFARRALDSTPPVPRSLERFAFPSNLRRQRAEDIPRMDEFKLRAPASDLLAAAAGAGHLSFDFDSLGRARRLPLWASYEERIFPAFALATASAAGSPAPRGDGPLLLNYPQGGTDDEDNEVAGTDDVFGSTSLAAALSDKTIWKSFRGQVVVIGVTAPGMGARFPTPGGRRVCEPELLAVALDNLLSDRPLQRAPVLWHWLLTVVPCLVVGGLSVTWRPAWSAMVAILCCLIVALVSLGLFGRNIWLDASVPWAAIGATCLVGVTGQMRRRERENVSIASTVEALAQVAEIVAVGKTPDELLERVVAFAAKSVGASGASAFLLDETRGASGRPTIGLGRGRRRSRGL